MAKATKSADQKIVSLTIAVHLLRAALRHANAAEAPIVALAVQRAIASTNAAITLAEHKAKESDDD